MCANRKQGRIVMLAVQREQGGLLDQVTTS
jgi:hypothetical protein